MDQATAAAAQQSPWNKDRLVGQKLPLRLKEIWAIRSSNRSPGSGCLHRRDCLRKF